VQKVLGCFQKRLAYSEESLEDLAGEEVSKQLKFENLIPEEEKTPEIIPILPGELQPRKVEEVIPKFNVLSDTYIIYPNEGYHPFHGVPNTPPRYQQKIWPYIKRIKFSEKYKSEKAINNVRKSGTFTREHHTLEQINSFISQGYVHVTLFKNKRGLRDRPSRIKKNGRIQKDRSHVSGRNLFHRLVALAFIPNPENKPFVLHINDDSSNYLIENLKWGTQRENMKEVSKRPDTMEQKYLDLVNKGVIKG